MRDRRKALTAILAALLVAEVIGLVAFLRFSGRLMRLRLEAQALPPQAQAPAPSLPSGAGFKGFSTAIRTINYPGRGSHIRVAVLSAPNFDPGNQIDQTSITFGRTGDERSLEFCRTDEMNGDGVPDLVCQFKTDASGFSRGVAQEGILRAMDVNRIRLEGRDTVTVPCDPRLPCGPSP